MRASCSVEGCDRTSQAKGYCKPHYARWRRSGDPLPVSTEDRFWAKVDKQFDGCWLWTAGCSDDGYGSFHHTPDPGRPRTTPAHRFAYELLVGPVPDGLELDHLCRVRHCVRPDHLDPVTHAENVLRGVGAAAQAARRTHCPKGHAYEGANLYIEPSTGARRCLTCKRETGLRYARRAESVA